MMDEGIDLIREMWTWLADRGARADLDVIAEGETSAEDADGARRTVESWAEAGATWWLESNWELPHHSAERMQQVRDRITAGPPSPAM